ILRYKKQLIEKGVDLSEYSDTESDFGVEPPPSFEELLLNKEGISNEVQDDLMEESSSSSNSPTTTTSFRDIPTQGFKFISSQIKKDESNTTVLNDYVNNNLNREFRPINFQFSTHRIMMNIMNLTK